MRKFNENSIVLATHNMGKFEEMIESAYGTLKERTGGAGGYTKTNTQANKTDPNDTIAQPAEIQSAKDAEADVNDPNHQAAKKALDKKRKEDKKNIEGLRKSTLTP